MAIRNEFDGGGPAVPKIQPRGTPPKSTYIQPVKPLTNVSYAQGAKVPLVAPETPAQKAQRLRREAGYTENYGYIPGGAAGTRAAAQLRQSHGYTENYGYTVGGAAGAAAAAKLRQSHGYTENYGYAAGTAGANARATNGYNPYHEDDTDLDYPGSPFSWPEPPPMPGSGGGYGYGYGGGGGGGFGYGDAALTLGLYNWRIGL